MTLRDFGKRIFFRVDSSALMGSGHLRRCLTLAQALSAGDAEITFICRQHVGSLDSEVVQAGFRLILLPEPTPTDMSGYASWLGVQEDEDARQAVAAIGNDGCDCLVVDHYALGEIWHKIARNVTQQIVVIDDLANRALDCDIVIDVAPADPTRYDALVPENAQKLLGPDYALIAPQFLQQARSLSNKGDLVSNVLITYGGFDTNNDTLSAIDGVRAALGFSTSIHVVLGSKAPHLETIRERAADDPQLFLHIDTGKMAELMADADLAIGACGTTSWERAYLGLPSLISIIAENQRATANALADAGCGILLPADNDLQDSIKHMTASLSLNSGLMQLMAAAAMKLVDGRGAKRIVAQLVPPDLQLRSANETDSDKLWQWRNASHVRSMSLSSDPISLESHQRWLAARLADQDCVILIGYHDRMDIGAVRYDIHSGVARISIQLADDVPSGFGFGSALLKIADSWLDANRTDVNEVHADVLSENSASLALFRAASYEPYQLQFHRKILR